MREGLEIKTLADLFDIGSSKRVYESQWRDSGVPFYRAREIVKLSNDGFVDNDLFIDEELFNEYANKYGIPKSGDIMVTGVGTLGVCYIVKENDKFYFKDGNILWFKTKKGTNPFYVNYAFKSNFLRQQIDNWNGATVGTFTILRAKQTKILVPPLFEQERIVSELDLLSGVIEKKKAQLKELDNLAQSIFYDMFGDPVTNEKGWEDEKMYNICTITSSKRIFANEYCEDGIPFYRGKEISELSKGLPISVELSISYDRYEEIKSEFGVPLVGDILITAVGTIGNIWVVNDDKPFYFKDGNIIWLKEIKGYNPIFFRKLLSILIDAYKHEMAQGCAYNALTIVNLKKMKALCPPLSFQQQFAEKIEAIEHQKELIKQSIIETETLFNSRMDYYFN